MPRRLAVLGATGSIGTATLDVVRHMPQRFAVDSLSGHRNWKLLAEQAREFRPRCVVVTGPERGDASEFPPDCQLLFGEEALCDIASAASVDAVVAAIVGAAGLRSTLAAITAGKTVALANKETLVVAGCLVETMAKPGNYYPSIANTRPSSSASPHTPTPTSSASSSPDRAGRSGGIAPNNSKRFRSNRR